MVGMEIVDEGRALLQLADRVLELGSISYRKSAAWAGFCSQVRLLHNTHANLEAQLKNCAQSATTVGSGVFLGVLQDTKKVISEEVEQLLQGSELRAGRSSGWKNLISVPWLEKLRKTVPAFPREVGFAIQSAVGAYDRLVKDILRVSGSTSFCQDIQSFYVPLERSESRIVSALMKVGVGSPNVVLVYGAPGKGKSTVTTQLSLRYAEDKSAFDGVVLLECGPEVDAQAKEIELLQKLGWNNLSEMSQLRTQTDDFKVMRHSRLRNLLRSHKLLIVLDDLWSPRFLQTLLKLSGPTVKYLVTSRQEHICANVSCVSESFQIEDLDEETSRKMLAVHAGLPRACIPDDLQECADKMLSQAHGIPLVIATMGAQIAKAALNTKAGWSAVLKSSSECLERKPAKFVLGEDPYPTSYWSALTQSINGLSSQEEGLLFLIGMCSGTSIPQTVLFFLSSILCSEQGSRQMNVLHMKTELKSRRLVEERAPEQLSIHALTKKFILEQREEETKSLAALLYSEDSHSPADESAAVAKNAKVICALVCLYLDKRFGEPMAIQNGHSSDKFTESAKATIEPITQLLFRDVNWTEELHQSAAQVFADFLCDESLSNHHLSQLLRSSTWTVPTLKFLENISLLDKSFWKSNTVEGILSILNIMLGDQSSPDVQSQAAQTLAGLVSQCLNSEDILRTPGVLCEPVHRMANSYNPDGRADISNSILLSYHNDTDDFSYDIIRKLALFPPLLPVLVKSLADDRNSFLQMQAATAIRNLACTMDSKFQCKIVNCPLLLKTLVTLLRKSQNPGLQSGVAWILGSMAVRADEALRRQMMDFPDLLHNLKNSLDQDNNGNLQVEAARALLNLGCTLDTPKLLQILAVSLDRKDDHFLQRRASRALDDLACQGDAMKDQILVFPGLLEKLVESLDDNLNFALPIQSARVLLNLTATKNASIRARILSSPLLLGNLTTSLSKRQNPGLQSNAVGAICNLVCGADFAVKEQLASFPNLLQNLEKSLDQDDDTELRSRAAETLINLANLKNISIKVRIVSSPLVLKNLVALLKQGEDALLQADAAWAIEDLAVDGADQAMREQIASFPNLINSLEDSLERHDNSYLQVQAAKTLMSLGWTKDIIKLLRILAMAFEKKEYPNLQARAAIGLVSLANGSDVLRGQILDFPGLFENLINSLDHDYLQLIAVQALLNLACTTETSIKARMLSCSTLLQNLVALLRKSQHPLLQADVALIIARLAGEGADQAIREQIAIFPNLLDSLEDCLEKDSPYLRVQASKTLINLMWAKDTPKLLRILAVPFEESQDPVLQARAAEGLVYLADGDDVMKNKILDYPGLFHNLVKSLEFDHYCVLPVEAARALSNLASTTDTSVKSRISSSPLLKSLVDLLDGDNVGLQQNAASTIANLSGVGADEAVRQQMASFPGLIDKLVIVLGNRRHPLLQRDAARALSNLPHSMGHTVEALIASLQNARKLGDS